MRATARRFGVAILVTGSTLLGAACRGESNIEVATEPCDPLVSHEQPIALNMPIAAGKDQDGTVYAADHNPVDGEARVFVSRADTLVRRRVLGSGTRGNVGSTDYTWSYEDPAGPRRLVAHVQGDRTTGIALVADTDRTFLDALTSNAQPLTPLATSELTGFKLQNLPGEVTLEYVARAGNGATILVTRPRDDWSYDDFRVFYGASQPLAEQPLLSVLRGSYTTIKFLLNGADATVTFSSALAPAQASTLETTDGTFPLTIVEPPALPDGTSFLCLP